LKVTRILLLYYVPLGTVKIKHYVDGFTSAIELLAEEYEITWLNLAEHGISNPIENLSIYQVILVKSNWGARVDRYTRKHLSHSKIPKCLLISGSLPPDSEGLQFYDVLFYETTWYKKFISAHPRSVKAFGVNTDVMTPLFVQKSIDWLTVGQFKWYKRMHLIAKKKGNKVAIGEKPKFMKFWKQEIPVYMYLKMRGVHLKGFLPYAELAEVYNKTNHLFIPAKLNGGGERAVMEAKSCGVKHIEVLSDNPKLTILKNEPVLSHIDYAQSLKKGISLVL